MVINVKVCNNRELIFDNEAFGTVIEDKATVLRFSFPSELKNTDKQLVFANSSGKQVYDFTNDFAIPDEVLTEEKLHMQLVCRGSFTWLSKVYTIRLNKTILTDKDDITTTLISEARRDQHDEDRIDVIEARNKCEVDTNHMSPTDYSAYSWNDMMNTIINTSFVTEADRQKLAEYNTVIEEAAAIDETKTPLQIIDTYGDIVEISDTPIEDLTIYNQIVDISESPIQDLNAYNDIVTAALFDTTKTPLQMINTYHQITDISDSPIEDLTEYNQIVAVSDTPIQDLTDYNEIESAAAQTENKNPLDMIAVWSAIEQEAEEATDYIPLLSKQVYGFRSEYDVPYLNTHKVTNLTANVNRTINEKCTSCGIDCSSMDGNGLVSDYISFFCGAFVGNSYLKSVKITNMQSITTTNRLFYNCTALRTVDLDGLQATNLLRMFVGCTSLTNIILHDSIIKDSLDLSATQNLTEDSVITVLQATGTGLTNKTLKFNSAASSILTGAAANAKSAAEGRGWQIAIA